MDPKFTSQPPSQTLYLDQLIEQKRQMQLARAKEICEEQDLIRAKVALLQEELVDLRRKVGFAEFEDIDLNAPEEPRVRGELNWAEYLLVSDIVALYRDIGSQNDDIMESHLAQQEPTGQGWKSYFSSLPFINGSKSSEETKIPHM